MKILNFSINSPCIDSGNPNPWFQDRDESISDMGSTGGLFIKTNFTNFNFGEIGTNESSTELTFFNYRESPILIDSVSFNTEVFFSNTTFPLTIGLNESRSINIIANNSISGDINGQMEMISSDLPTDININLSAFGVEDLTLSGNLIGNIAAATYRITGDILITNNETVIIEAGTKFLFDV